VRVGVIGAVGPDYFAENVGDSLRRMGHEVAYLGPARALHMHWLATAMATTAMTAVPSLDERVQQRIVRAAREAACEVVINLDLCLLPEVVRALRRDGRRVAFWYPDHVANLGRQLMLLAPYDALFFKEQHLVDRLRANLDLPVWYLPEACNPRWHRPLVPAGSEPHLVIAGSMYPSRVKLLERVMAKGIPLRLYGGAFPRWLGETPLRAVHTGQCVFREDKARAFRSAAGVLNSLHPGEISGLNARLFEATGCGAAVLTEFRPTLPDLYDTGREVLAFRDFDELIDQATRLLTEPGLTARLGDAAAGRAHREHSYQSRLATILEKVT
jgi:spore maturation protein CgeB